MDATLGVLQEFLAGATDGWELALDELASDPEAFLARPRTRSARSPARCTRALGSDSADPAFAPEEPSTEALSLLTATIDEEIERIFLDLPDDEALAPIRGRGAGRARAAAGALATSAPAGA